MPRFPIPPAFALLALAGLAGCVGHLPPLRADQVVTISGRQTVGLAPDAAQRKILVEASHQTIDHGFRYFTILPNAASKTAMPGAAAGGAMAGPGMDVRVRLLRPDQVRRGTAGLFDAYRIVNAKPGAAPK